MYIPLSFESRFATNPSASLFLIAVSAHVLLLLVPTLTHFPASDSFGFSHTHFVPVSALSPCFSFDETATPCVFGALLVVVLVVDSVAVLY